MIPSLIFTHPHLYPLSHLPWTLPPQSSSLVLVAHRFQKYEGILSLHWPTFTTQHLNIDPAPLSHPHIIPLDGQWLQLNPTWQPISTERDTEYNTWESQISHALSKMTKVSVYNSKSFYDTFSMRLSLLSHTFGDGMVNASIFDTLVPLVPCELTHTPPLPKVESQSDMYFIQSSEWYSWQGNLYLVALIKSDWINSSANLFLKASGHMVPISTAGHRVIQSVHPFAQG